MQRTGKLLYCWIAGFAVFAFSSDGRWYLLTYPFLLLTALSLGIRFANGAQRYLKIALAIAGTIGVFYLHGYFHTYEVKGESETGNLITDTRHFWTGKNFYRSVKMVDSNGDWVGGGEGPIAGTGKHHGKWDYFQWKPFTTETVFYWYGEAVTEGEWHLRNN